MRARVWLARAGVAAVAAVLAAWAIAPFVVTALDAAAKHRMFTGVAGLFPWDGLQYLAFVRDGHDGLIRNLFGLSGASAVFAHPMWSLTGVVQGLTGVGSVPIMAFWKAVSVVVLCAGAARLVARHIPTTRPGRRTIALGLCLFGGFTPLAFLLANENIGDFRGAAIDLIPAATLWDYAPIAIAIGLMPFAIGGMDRLVAGAGSRRTVVWTAACCLIIGWLHPWQAATLMIVWLGLLLWRVYDARAAGSAGTSIADGSAGRSVTDGSAGRSVTDGSVKPAVGWPVIVGLGLATGAAPAYYACLSRLDFSWSQFSQTDTRYLAITWPVLEYCLAPLVIAALVCARAARRDRGARSLVVWVLATLVVVALRPPEQYHALDGLVFPLGVLVVRAWPGSRGLSLSRVVAVAGVAALAATFAIFAGNSLRAVDSPRVTQYSELAPSDVRAVTLAAGADGDRPILTTGVLGSALPMLADAPTWVGNFLWTPNGVVRTLEAKALFQGSLDPGSARRFVLSTGARVIVAPCASPADLAAALAPLGFRERAVGCARVYVRAG